MFRRGIVVIAILVVIVAAAGAVAWSARPKKVTVTVDVTGTPGMTVKGTAEVDGEPQEWEGKLPQKPYVFEGSRVVFTLTSTDDEGEFRVKTSVNGDVVEPGTSGNPPRNGVRGWVQSGWGWSPPGHWVEPFDREKQPAWLKPPP